MLALVGKKVVFERQSSRILSCKKRHFKVRINNTLNIWTKKRTFLVQFRPRSSKPTPLFFALSCLLFRLWRSASLLEIASKREREREIARHRLACTHIIDLQKKSKGFTKEKHYSKAFSFVFFPERRREKRDVERKTHLKSRTS